MAKSKPAKHRLIRLMKMYGAGTKEYMNAYRQYRKYYGKIGRNEPPSKEGLLNQLNSLDSRTSEYRSVYNKLRYWHDPEFSAKKRRVNKRTNQNARDRKKLEISEIEEKELFQYIFKELTEIIRLTS